MVAGLLQLVLNRPSCDSTIAVIISDLTIEFCVCDHAEDSEYGYLVRSSANGRVYDEFCIRMELS